MFQVVEDRAEQEAIYNDLRKGLTKKFVKVVQSPPGETSYTSFEKFKKDSLTSEYGLTIWSDPNRLSMSLWGPPIFNEQKDPKNILQFTTFTERSGTTRTAGILARNSEMGKIGLLHDGRVYARDGRGRPSWPVKAEAGGKDYNLIGYVENSDLFPNIVEYHRSRINPDLSVDGNLSPDFSKKGFDPGVKEGGTRSAAVFSAVHSPIAEALKAKCITLGFNVTNTQVVSPDLLVSNNIKKILFEIKPYAKAHDLMLALGQLLTYNTFSKADALVLVSQQLRDDKLVDAIKNLVAQHQIQILEYNFGSDGKIKFPKLKHLLS